MLIDTIIKKHTELFLKSNRNYYYVGIGIVYSLLKLDTYILDHK